MPLNHLNPVSAFCRWLLSVLRPAGALYLCAGLLSGCADPPQAMFEDYLARLGRSLDQEVVALTAMPPLPFPPRRALAIDFPRQSIGLIDLYKLADCELHELIARRNSILGKVARPSSQLVYELHFLALARQCVVIVRESEPELTDYLESVIEAKQQQLPQRIWQAILGAEEWRQFWNAPQRLGDYPAQTSSAVIESLEYLNAKVIDWQAGQWSVDRALLEKHLQRVAGGDGGALLAAWQLTHRYLSAATSMIEQRTQSRPLCIKGMSTGKGKVFATVTRKFFIGRVQPWLADINRRQYELMAAVTALERALLSASPAAYRQWTDQRAELLKRATAAPRRHVEAIRPVLESCALLPASGSR